MHLTFDLIFLLVSGCIAFVIASMYVKPPPRYPDLWPVLVSAFSAAHFGLFYLYFNFYQVWSLTQFFSVSFL